MWANWHSLKNLLVQRKSHNKTRLEKLDTLIYNALMLYVKIHLTKNKSTQAEFAGIRELSRRQLELSGPIGSVLVFLWVEENQPLQSLTCLIARTALI